MKIHLVNGFLGSGKTTAIQQAYSELERKQIKAGVITNDQGQRLVDGDFYKQQYIRKASDNFNIFKINRRINCK